MAEYDTRKMTKSTGTYWRRNNEIPLRFYNFFIELDFHHTNQPIKHLCSPDLSAFLYVSITNPHHFYPHIDMQDTREKPDIYKVSCMP